MTLIQRLLSGALLAIAAINAAHSAGLGVPKPDSVQATGAAALPPSACPNLTDDWYATVPSGYFRAAADGNCYADTSCTYGVNAARNACVVGTVPSVTLSMPAGTYSRTNFNVSWNANGTPMPTGATISCYNGAWAMVASWNVGGASGTTALYASDSMVGAMNCRASASNAVGTGYSAFVSFVVSCPPGLTYQGGVCQQALYSCPGAISVWNSVPLPLYDANPSQNLPDGHQWCMYYGNSNGDWWMGAFDRVVGLAVGFLPTYTDNGYGYSFSWTPQYGSATSTAYGGKCVNSSNKSGFWQAYTMNDCGSLATPIAVWNFLPDNPLRAKFGAQYVGRGVYQPYNGFVAPGIPVDATCTNMTGWGCFGAVITYPGQCVEPYYNFSYSTGIYTAINQRWCTTTR